VALTAAKVLFSISIENKMAGFPGHFFGTRRGWFQRRGNHPTPTLRLRHYSFVALQ
jgi:hypothetical protein